MDNIKWRDVYLAHLSKDCNSKVLLNNMFSPQNGFLKKFSVNIVDPEKSLFPTHDLQNRLE